MTTPPGTAHQTAGAPAHPPGGSGWRRAVIAGPAGRIWRAVSIVLLVLGCVAAPLSVTAVWARNLVQDETAYIEAVGPLAEDPVVIDAAQNRIVTAIDDAISGLSLADRLGDELRQLGLPSAVATVATAYAASLRGELTARIDDLVHRVLTSEQFVNLWNTANAKTHEALVRVLTGDTPDRLHSISLDLSQAVATVKQRLQDSGVEFASRIPDIPVVLNLSDIAEVQAAQGYYNLLIAVAGWLPWVTVILLLGSVVIASDRLRGLGRAAAWLAVSMVVLTLLLLVGRWWLVTNAPSQPDVTRAFLQQVTVNLRDRIRLIFGSAVVVAVLAWLFGSSSTAVALRRAVVRLSGRIGNSGWALWVRVGAGVAAVVLVAILLSLDTPGLLAALLLVVPAALLGIIAATRSPVPVPAGAAVPPAADLATQSADTRPTRPQATDTQPTDTREIP